MIAKPQRMFCLHCLAITAALVMLSQGSVLAEVSDCGPLPCPQRRTGPGIHTLLNGVQDSDIIIEEPRYCECQNPCDSESWTVEDWVGYFHLEAFGWDYDEFKQPGWEGDPCNGIPCTLVWSDWVIDGGGPVEVVWSMPYGPPDLCNTGATYIIRATFTELSDTDNNHPPCEPEWPVDPQVHRDCYIHIQPVGKCCHADINLYSGPSLQSGCDYKTEPECPERYWYPYPYTFEHQWFGDQGPCCDPTGCCWKNPPGNYPSPHADEANEPCCDKWPGDQFLPGKTCCGVTEPGNGSLLLSFDENCNDCWGSEHNPIETLKDDCGSVVELRCEGSGWPWCEKEYRIYYNGYQFSKCIFAGGLNYAECTKSADQRRFVVLYHRTESPSGPPYRWKINQYNCVTDSDVPGYPKCCESNTPRDENNPLGFCPTRVPCTW